MAKVLYEDWKVCVEPDTNHNCPHAHIMYKNRNNQCPVDLTTDENCFDCVSEDCCNNIVSDKPIPKIALERLEKNKGWLMREWNKKAIISNSKSCITTMTVFTEKEILSVERQIEKKWRKK